MIRTIALKPRREILSNIRNQYQESNRLGKTKLLDGFIAASGYNEKYAIKVQKELTNHLRHASLDSNMSNRR
jgi:hypothetical protein